MAGQCRHTVCKNKLSGKKKNIYISAAAYTIALKSFILADNWFQRQQSILIRKEIN